MNEIEEMKNNGATELVGAVAFQTDEYGHIYEAKALMKEKIDEMTPEEFAKAFLIDRVINQSDHRMSRENSSRNAGIDR